MQEFFCQSHHISIQFCSFFSGRHVPPPSIDCIWGPWQQWSTCSASCGDGQMSRTRGKVQEARHGGQECLGSDYEVGTCNLGQCLPPKDSVDICYRESNEGYSDRFLVELPSCQNKFECLSDALSFATTICRKGNQCCQGSDTDQNVNFLEMTIQEVGQLVDRVKSCKLELYSGYSVEDGLFTVVKNQHSLRAQIEAAFIHNNGTGATTFTVSDGAHSIGHIIVRRWRDIAQFRMRPFARRLSSYNPGTYQSPKFNPYTYYNPYGSRRWSYAGSSGPQAHWG